MIWRSIILSVHANVLACSCVCICMHFCMSEHQLLCAGEQLWEQFCPQTSKRDTIYSDWLLQTCTAAGHLSRGSRLVSNQSDAPARVTGCAASWQQPIIAWLHSNARSSCLLAAQCDDLSCLTHQAEPSLQLPEVLALVNVETHYWVVARLAASVAVPLFLRP